MNKTAVVDTGFLISLVDKNRSCHEAAKSYYKYCLENQISLLLPTIAISEFAIKQPPQDLPLRNFRVLPFGFKDAVRCAELNFTYYRQKLKDAGQRDSIKDDFKIIAQAEEQQVRCLITEDDNTLEKYCDALTKEGKIHFRLANLRQGFDVALVNETGQRDLELDT